MPKKPIARIALFTTALSLTACAHSTPPISVAKEKASMIAGSQTVQPTLTAEQGLLRLLELIRTSLSISDITPDRVKNVMGVALTPDSPDTLWFSEVLTPHWRHALSTPLKFDPDKRGYENSLEYGFGDIPSGSAPPLTDLCQIDFEHFAKELVAMGYSRESVYDSPPQPPTGWPALPHGRRMYDGFRGPGPNGLLIEVYPEGEADDPSEKVIHLCVRRIFIF